MSKIEAHTMLSDRGVKKRIERRNSKADLASALARIQALLWEAEEGETDPSRVQMQSIMDRVIL